MRIVAPGSTDITVELQAIKASDGTNETGITYNASGIDMWYRRNGGSKVTITTATLASLTTGHTDGGLLHIDDGVFRLDVPDAAFALGADTVTIGGSATGTLITPITISLQAMPLILRSGLAQSGAAGSVTLDAGASSGTDFYTGNVVQIVAGTGAGQARMIIGYNGTTKVATVDRNWATNPASGSLFMILPTGVKGMTSTEVASAVLGATAASYDSAGTIGEKINDAGAGGSPPTETEIATELMGTSVVSGITVLGALRILLAVLSGKSTKAGSVISFRDPGDTKNVVSATVDSDNQRTSVSRDVS